MIFIVKRKQDLAVGATCSDGADKGSENDIVVTFNYSLSSFVVGGGGAAFHNPDQK
jgi:hypothetical protein